MEQEVQYERVFQALADKNRLKILNLLLHCEMNAGQILQELDIVQSTLSHHMKILCEAQLVISARRGKWTCYALNLQMLDATIGFLTELKRAVLKDEAQSLPAEAEAKPVREIALAEAEAKPVREKAVAETETAAKPGQEKVLTEDRGNERAKELSQGSQDRHKEKSKEKGKEKGKEKEKEKNRDKSVKNKEKDKEKVKAKEKDEEKDREKDKEKDKEKDREKDKEKDKDRDKGKDRLKEKAKRKNKRYGEK